MLVASSFDLWQKDVFFSAAEEVQHSADIMESAYRTWVRQRREGLAPQYLNQLCRELQTALGTAKWQLDEFEKAVGLSYRNRADDITTNRHRQFVVAIGTQISRVEAELRESFNQDGKEPLRWVNLDEGERDDLAMFLSGTTTVKSQGVGNGSNPKFVNSTQGNVSEKDGFNVQKVDSCKDVSNQIKSLKHVQTRNVDNSYVVELVANESPGTSDSSCSQADRKVGSRKTCSSSSNIGALKITIDSKNEDQNALMLSIEATPKEKGSKPVFGKTRYGDHPHVKGGMLCQTKLGGIPGIYQLFRMFRGSHRQLQTLNLQRNRSFRLSLVIMITFLFIVPFLCYSV